MNNGFARPKAPTDDHFGLKCIKCGGPVSHTERGLHLKMINRGAKEFMCIHCLSEYIDVSEEELMRKAEQFKKMGCSMFL